MLYALKVNTNIHHINLTILISLSLDNEKKRYLAELKIIRGSEATAVDFSLA